MRLYVEQLGEWRFSRVAEEDTDFIIFFIESLMFYFCHGKSFYFKYSSVYMLMPNSQSIPPPLPP